MNMALLVYLMRHGIAEDPRHGLADADRALTDEGEEKTARVAAGLRTLGVRPDAILSSPLRRAEQTARIAAGRLGGEVTLTPLLAPGTAPRTLVGGLHDARGARQLLLVGHQPDLGELASFLLTGSPGLVPLPFKKAAVAAIQVGALPPRGPGLLHWFLTPGQLRAIASGSK